MSKNTSTSARTSTSPKAKAVRAAKVADLQTFTVTGDYAPTTVRSIAMAAGGVEAKAQQSVAASRMTLAKVTAVVVRDGLIGKGGDAQWPTATDYARTLATSPSNVTGLRRLGYALLAGLDASGADSERWGVLSDKVNVKDVGAVLVEGVTLDAVREVADRLIREKAETKAEGATKRAPRPATEKDDEKGDESVPTVEATPAQSVSLALQTLAKHLPTLTDAEWAEVESRMGDLITREVTVRTAKATKARKATAKAPRAAKATKVA